MASAAPALSRECGVKCWTICGVSSPNMEELSAPPMSISAAQPPTPPPSLSLVPLPTDMVSSSVESSQALEAAASRARASYRACVEASTGKGAANGTGGGGEALGWNEGTTPTMEPRPAASAAAVAAAAAPFCSAAAPPLACFPLTGARGGLGRPRGAGRGGLAAATAGRPEAPGVERGVALPARTPALAVVAWAPPPEEADDDAGGVRR